MSINCYDAVNMLSVKVLLIHFLMLKNVNVSKPPKDK